VYFRGAACVENVLEDGIKGAFKRIAKEMHLKVAK